MTSFAVVGAGWRAEMFWRLAEGVEGVDCLGVVVRTRRSLPVPTHGSLADVREADFIVTAVPWAAGWRPSAAASSARLYDFTDNQWHNQLRFRRILVRGSHGELRDDEVVRLTAPRTIVRTPLVRRHSPGGASTTRRPPSHAAGR
jgi:hypothetical protein